VAEKSKPQPLRLDIQADFLPRNGQSRTRKYDEGVQKVKISLYAKSTSSMSSSAGQQASVAHGLKILLVEPDAMLGETYQQAFEHSGHTVFWGKTAQEGLHILDENQVDLIISELQLAMHNGLEFLYELRTYNDWRDIPVIVLTHVPPISLQMTKALSSNLGVVAYHYKPLTKLQDLIHSVEQISVIV